MRVSVPAVALALAATPFVATAQAPPADDAALGSTATPGDPFESFNRTIWGLNRGIDRVAIKPVSTVYRTVTPKPARRGISKVFANLSEPWSFINNLLQGKVGRAASNLGRFVVNTTIGVGGLADHASELGIKPAPEDFGQTLAVWGVKSSAYLVLPLFGPSTVRDGIGTGVGFVADPYNICINRCTNLSWVQRTGLSAVNLVSIRAELTESGADAFLDSSLDSYATARSAYLQNRAAAIANADPGDDTAGEAPAVLDPTTADAPPADGADTPAAPGVDPAPPASDTPTDPAAPKLSFNLTTIEG